MKLVTVPSSPFGRKVAVVASELGLLDQVEVVYDNPWKPDTRVPELNPVGKVPVICAASVDDLHASARLIASRNVRN